jgi:hypothetical protein
MCSQSSGVVRVLPAGWLVTTDSVVRLESSTERSLHKFEHPLMMSSKAVNLSPRGIQFRGVQESTMFRLVPGAGMKRQAWDSGRS